jgi:hypothetical protein
MPCGRILPIDEMAGDIGVGKNNKMNLCCATSRKKDEYSKRNGNFEDEELISIYKKYTGESPPSGEKEYNDLAASIREKQWAESTWREEEAGHGSLYSKTLGIFKMAGAARAW